MGCSPIVLAQRPRSDRLAPNITLSPMLLGVPRPCPHSTGSPLSPAGAKSCPGGSIPVPGAKASPVFKSMQGVRRPPAVLFLYPLKTWKWGETHEDTFSKQQLGSPFPSENTPLTCPPCTPGHTRALSVPTEGHHGSAVPCARHLAGTSSTAPFNPHDNVCDSKSCYGPIL